MPREYTLVVRKDVNQEEFITMYLTDGYIDMVSSKASPLHDATHPILASFIEAIGIKVISDSSTEENNTHKFIRQSSILNEILIAGISYQTIPKYQRMIRNKVINSLKQQERYNHQLSISIVLRQEAELIKITSKKYFKQLLYDSSIQSNRLWGNIDKENINTLLETELSNTYPNLDKEIEILILIFRLARILGRKINQRDSNTVIKWNQIADRHEQWLTNYLEKQDFKVRSKTKKLSNIQDYQIIVGKMNALIAKLPSYLIN